MLFSKNEVEFISVPSNSAMKYKEKKYRILMFATDSFPPILPEAIVTSKLLLAMQKKGWDVNVVTSKQIADGTKYPYVEHSVWHPIVSKIYPIYSPDEKNIANIIKRVMTIFKTGHLTDGLAWVKESIKQAEYLAGKKRFDIILSRSYCEYSHLPAMYLSSKWNVPWIANWNDPVPLTRFLPPRGAGLDGRIKWYTQRFLNAVSLNASWHTFPSERLRRYMHEYLPFDMLKSSVIPHILLDNLIPERADIVSNKFVLCHAGGLNPKSDRDPTLFLMGLRQFIEANDAKDSIMVKFVGCNSAEISPIVTMLGLCNNVTVDGFVAYEDTLAIMAEATVLFLIEESAKEGIYLPSKFVDYVQTGRPVLAISPRHGTASDLLYKYGGGLAVDCTSYNDIADGINKLYSSWESGTLSMDYNVSSLSEVFSEETVLTQYEDTFERILSK